MKRIPVNIPLDNSGSISDIINDFVNKLQNVTGGDVEVQCSIDGEVTIYYEAYPTKNKLASEQNIQYRGDGTSLKMFEPKTKRIREDGTSTRNQTI